MRKDILINVNSENNKFKIDNKILGITSENLQGKIIFKPEPFVDGVCRLYVDGKGSILMDKQEDCYTVNILSSLLTEDSLDICFKITEPEIEDGIPIFCSKIMHFRVLETIESSSTIPEDYPSWEQVLDSMMAKIEQMESDAEDRLDEVVGQIQDLTSTYNTNATNKTNAFNTNATNKTTAFNQNYATKVTEIDGAVSSAKSDLVDYTEEQKAEIEGSVDNLIAELDTHENIKEGELDSYTNTKKTELNTYTNTKKSELDDYEEDKEAELSSFASNKTSDFNSNASAKTTAFNNNAIDKTDDFDDNATSKTTAFNENATSKTGDFNTNATSKTTAFDDNASTKLGAYNTNHTTKLAEYNSNATSKVSDYNTNASTKTSEFDQNASDKTDDFDDNASEKTTAFNDNATAKIAEYDAHVSELQSQVDDLTTLVETELESNEVEGTEIDVSDSAEYRGPVIPGANLEQEQLSGKNLWGIFSFTKTQYGVEHTQNSDGTFVVNGTATDRSYSMTSGEATSNNRLITLPAGTYCLSGGSPNVRLQVCNINGLAICSTNSSDIFTIDTDTQVFVRTYVLQNITVTNEKLYAQLEQGSTATDWEPYCGGQPSPNPDYPQEIKVVTGDNTIKHVGKNIIPTDFSCYESGHYDTTGRKSANPKKIRAIELYPVEPNTEYYLSVILDESLSSEGITFLIREYSKNDDATMVRNTGIIKNMSFVTSANTKYISVSIGATTSLNYDFNKWKEVYKLMKFQLEKGSTPTSYEPYRESEYELDLGNIELCKIGDYSDILFKNVIGDENYNAELESGAWYKKSAIKKNVLNGSESWRTSIVDTSVETIRFARNVTSVNNSPGYCNKLHVRTIEPHTDTEYLYLSGTVLYININKERLSELSLNAFIIFLQENNIIHYYISLTSEYTKITDPTLISQLEALRKAKWFKGVNHWWTETENLEPNLKGTYKQSNNLRLQALEQAIVALGGV